MLNHKNSFILKAKRLIMSKIKIPNTFLWQFLALLLFSPNFGLLQIHNWCGIYRVADLSPCRYNLGPTSQIVESES